MSDTFTSKRHDDGVSPVITFSPPTGLDWDLTEAGLAGILIARLPDASAPSFTGPVVVTDAWQVRYDPQKTDVALIGTYDVEVEFTRSNGKQITLPTVGYLHWTIEPDLDDA